MSIKLNCLNNTHNTEAYMKRALTILIATLLTAGALAQEPLSPGDAAPALEIHKWLQGEPFTMAEREGNITVVEFWATWCPPCKASIPHLSELAEKYREQGVRFVGISQESAEKISNFMEDTPFSYSVAADLEGQTTAAYMTGVSGIPHAFVVDAEGRIAWSGHPMGDLDGVLEGLLEGDFNREQFNRVQALREAMQQAAQQRDVEQAVDHARELLKVDPNAADAFGLVMYAMQRNADADEYFDWVDDMLSREGLSNHMYNNIAWILVTTDRMDFRDPGRALEAVNEAIEAEARYNFLDTKARVFYSIGLLDEAANWQEKALAAAPEEGREAMEQVLAYYRRARAMQADLSRADQ